MKADKLKLEIAMARACLNPEELTKVAKMPRPTINNVITGRSVRPGTMGRVAAALGVDVTEILAEGGLKNENTL